MTDRDVEGLRGAEAQADMLENEGNIYVKRLDEVCRTKQSVSLGPEQPPAHSRWQQSLT